MEETNVQLLHEEIAALKKKVSELELNEEMCDGILSEIRDQLVAMGTDMSATPPMFYREAICHTAKRLVFEASTGVGLEMAEATLDEKLQAYANAVINREMLDRAEQPDSSNDVSNTKREIKKYFLQVCMRKKGTES